MAALRVASAVRSASVAAAVTVGPETAARIGVPVGTTVELGTLASWHHNPIMRAWWKLTRRRRRSCLSE